MGALYQTGAGSPQGGEEDLGLAYAHLSHRRRAAEIETLSALLGNPSAILEATRRRGLRLAQLITDDDTKLIFRAIVDHRSDGREAVLNAAATLLRESHFWQDDEIPGNLASLSWSTAKLLHLACADAADVTTWIDWLIQLVAEKAALLAKLDSCQREVKQLQERRRGLYERMIGLCRGTEEPEPPQITAARPIERRSRALFVPHGRELAHA